MREVDGVTGTGVVDVVALLVRQAIITGVVDSFERKRRAEFIAFRGMVVNNVQDHFDAMRMKLIHHCLEFVCRGRVQIARFRGKERQRIVSPIVAQAFVHQIAVVDESVDGQQFGAGNSERPQIGGNIWIGQPGKSTALGFRNQRV